MKAKNPVSESRDELKKIYIEWLGLQHESRLNQIIIEDQGDTAMENNDIFRMSILVETTRVQDQIFMKYRLHIYDLERTAQEMKIIED